MPVSFTYTRRFGHWLVWKSGLHTIRELLAGHRLVDLGPQNARSDVPDVANTRKSLDVES
jgi:hypothetical protein